MEEYYSKVQCKDKNLNHLCSCIPREIAQHLGLSKSLFIKWTKNDDGSVTVAKSKSKPLSKDAQRLKYQEWVKKIVPCVPTSPPGKNPFEILKEVGLQKESISAVWVTWAKRDIGLNNESRDNRHRTLWFRTPQSSTVVSIPVQEGKDQKMKEPKVRTSTLGEFQEIKPQ
jgi:hypothetical protein